MIAKSSIASMFSLNIFYLVETRLIAFLISLFEKFMNSCFFFSFALLRKLWCMSITKFSTFTESLLSPFPAHICPKWQRQPTAKIFWSPSTPCVSWRRLLRCPIIEFVLSEEYVTQLSQSNENVSLYTSYICCAVEPLLIFGISSNDAAISPESLSTQLTKTGKNLSSSYHSLRPLLIRTYESRTAPLLVR